MTLHVGHVKGNYGQVGGIESMLEGVMPHLAQQPGVTPILYFVTRDRDPALEARLSAEGRVALRMIPWRGLMAAPLAARHLAQAMAQDGVGVIHTHDMRANLLAALQQPFTRRPWICHIHGWLGATHSPLYRAFEGVDRALMRRADLVLTGSHATLAEVQAAGARRARVLPNAVPLPPDLPRSAARAQLDLPQDAVIFTVMGRLHPGKGQDLFLRALAALPAAVNWLGVLTGTGPEDAALRALAVELGIADRLRFTGFVESTAPWVAASDVIAVPSRKESLPLTCLEGMAAARAVVAAAAGDLPRVIRQDETGIIVPVDDADALAAAFARLAADGALRDRLGVAARAHILRHHTAQVLAASMAQAARDLAAGVADQPLAATVRS